MKLYSYGLEIFCLLLVAVALWRLRKKKKNIASLMSEKRKNFIRLMELEMPKAEEDTSAQIGSIGVNSN